MKTEQNNWNGIQKICAELFSCVKKKHENEKNFNLQKQ